MIKRPNTNAQRLKRHKRVRSKISGTAAAPRLNVFRSEANIYAQIIDDVKGETLVARLLWIRRSLVTAATSPLPPQLASSLQSGPRRRGSKTLFLIVAVICTMAVFRHWPTAPARAA